MYIKLNSIIIKSKFHLAISNFYFLMKTHTFYISSTFLNILLPANFNYPTYNIQPANDKNDVINNYDLQVKIQQQYQQNSPIRTQLHIFILNIRQQFSEKYYLRNRLY